MKESRLMKVGKALFGLGLSGSLASISAQSVPRFLTYYMSLFYLFGVGMAVMMIGVMCLISSGRFDR